MSSYNAFAYFYDKLTNNISYSERAKYFSEIINQNIGQVELLLDLACGTGSLSIELNKLGFDVIGIDSSTDMLSVAVQKASQNEHNILFICQDMTKLDLYGTIDVVISALDSINHITSTREVQKVFNNVSLFLNPNGLFIFDVNSKYKHREVLANNTFVVEEDGIYCVWQNSLDEKTDTVNISLDFFEEENGAYYRSSENFSERAYSEEQIEAMLKKSGFEIIAIYEGDTFTKAKEKTERLVYVTRKTH